MKKLLLTLIALTSLVNASEIMKSYDTLFKLSQTDRGYALKNDTFSMHFQYWEW